MLRGWVDDGKEKGVQVEAEVSLSSEEGEKEEVVYIPLTRVNLPELCVTTPFSSPPPWTNPLLVGGGALEAAFE